MFGLDKTAANYHAIKGLRVGNTDLTKDANGKYALVFDDEDKNVTINGDPVIDELTYQNGVYLIKDLADLGTLSRYVAAGNTCAGLTFKVTAPNITNGLYQIGTAKTPFAGTFDGNGSTIEVVDVQGSTIDALFGYIDGATIKGFLKAGGVYEPGAVKKTKFMKAAFDLGGRI